MAKKHQSFQEELLAPLFESSLVSHFVFAPDEWAKGPKQKSREPADLVWICNNCVILMHMAGAKHHESRDRAIRVREERIEHNLGQLEGWMKAWRHGQSLNGRNNSATFSIPYREDFHVVALSIIKCAEAECRPHPELADKLGIAFCATLTQSVVEQLCAKGGSTLDLLVFMKILSATGEIGETVALSKLNDYLRDAFQAGYADTIWPDGKIDDRFWELARLLFGLRNMTGHGSDQVINHPRMTGTHLEAFCILNDFYLHETLNVITAFRKIVDDIKAEPQKMLAGIVKLSYYDYAWIMFSGLTNKASAFAADCLARFSEYYDAGRIRSGLVATYDTSMGPLVLSLKPRRGPSVTERLLDQWVIERGSRKSQPHPK